MGTLLEKFSKIEGACITHTLVAMSSFPCAYPSISQTLTHPLL